MLFKNISNGVEVNVSNLKMRNGRIFFTVRNKPCGQKFLNRNTCLVLDEHVEDGTFLKLAEGWELAKPAKPAKPAKAAKPAAPKATKAANDDAKATPATPASNASEEPKGDEKAAKPAANDTPASQPTKAAPKAKKAATATASEGDAISNAAKALAEAVRNAKAATIDEAKVREICMEVLASQPATPAEAANTVTIKVLGNDATNKVSNPHPLLKKVLALVVNDRAIGRYPWLFGPAGSGKSTLAKQIAEALNLPFYSVSSLQQKYELEGYTDAVGELVQTTFYKASTEGGIFLFDEASTTSGEVNVSFNSMLANLWYNFPKIGMVKAHPNFHVIAADNTTGRGGNSTYSARFQLDASTLDRYTAIKVDYTEEHDLFMAENDTQLVEFFNDMRNAIEAARLTYTASPRALRAIKQMQKMNDIFSEREAFYLGLCSSWSKSDMRTLAARLNGTNKYYKLFNSIANEK